LVASDFLIVSMGFFDSRNKVVYLGASDFDLSMGFLIFQQGVFDSEHTLGMKNLKFWLEIGYEST
jgi:hypothetical protein